MTREHLYGALLNIVEYSAPVYDSAGGNETINKRFNTFAVIRTQYDLRAQELANTRTKRPYLFIRQRANNDMRISEAKQYPLFSICENETKVDIVANRAIVTFQVILQDQVFITENTTFDGNVSLSNSQQVLDNLENLFFKFLGVINDYYFIENNNQITDGFWHKDLLSVKNIPPSGFVLSDYLITKDVNFARFTESQKVEGFENCVAISANLKLRLDLGCNLKTDLNISKMISEHENGGATERYSSDY